MNLIVSPHEKNTVCHYLRHDSPELFETNRHKLGPGWLYYNNPIEYRFNKMGYRMNQEVSQTDWDNYILFLGCSHGMGYGLHLENTYPVNVSLKLGVDYVNCAAPAASNEYILDNLIRGSAGWPQKPRAIVINWTHPSRLYYVEKGQVNFVYPGNIEKSHNFYRTHRDIIECEEYSDYKFMAAARTARLIARSAGIKLVEFVMFSVFSEDLGIFKILRPPHTDPTVVYHCNYYYARDIDTIEGRPYAHPGIYHNEVATEYILGQL